MFSHYDESMVQRTRDPDAKRDQLFRAALVEFAQYGLAGARVDRLTKRAGISAGLVYSFYEGKAELFDAVFDQIVELAISTVPIDADDLPGYAAGLYDAGVEHPEVARFMAWYQLERGEAGRRSATVAAMREKITAIEAAQRRGTLASKLPAPQILALVLAIANMWNQPGEELGALVPKGKRRETVVNAVAQLVGP